MSNYSNLPSPSMATGKNSENFLSPSQQQNDLCNIINGNVVGSRENAMRLFHVFLKGTEYMAIEVSIEEPFYNVLVEACRRKRLPIDKYYIYTKHNGHVSMPLLNALSGTVTAEPVYHLNSKKIYQFTHTRQSNQNHGFTVIGQDPETNLRCVYVDSVHATGDVGQQGLVQVGDLILSVNGQVCARTEFFNVIQTLRSDIITCVVITRRDIKDNSGIVELADIDFDANVVHRSVFLREHDINNLICPPCPTTSDLPTPDLSAFVLPLPDSNFLLDKGNSEYEIPLHYENYKESVNLQCDQTGLSLHMTSGQFRLVSPEFLSRFETLLADCDVISGKGPEGMRLMALQELLTTEENYVRDLNILIEQWLTPLSIVTWLSQEEKGVLWSNTIDLLNFHMKLLSELRPAIEVDLAGGFVKGKGSMEILASHYEGFLLYRDYCANSDRINEIVANMKLSPQFPPFEARQNPTGQQSTSFQSYLIRPIQRILKYPLLIAQAVKYTSPSQSLQRINGEKALVMLKEVMILSNEYKREMENQALEREFFTCLDSGVGDDRIIPENIGKLVYYSELYLHKGKEKEKEKNKEKWDAFMFEHEIIFCRRSRDSKGEKGEGKRIGLGLKIKDRIPISKLSLQVMLCDSPGKFAFNICDNSNTSSLGCGTKNSNANKKIGYKGRWSNSNEGRCYKLECVSQEIRDFWVEKLGRLLEGNL